MCNVANDEHRTAKRGFLFNSLPGEMVQISDSRTSILNSPHRKEKTQKLNTTFYFSPFTGCSCSILPTPDIWMNGWQIIVYFNAMRITLQVSIYGNWCLNPCSTLFQCLETSADILQPTWKPSSSSSCNIHVSPLSTQSCFSIHFNVFILLISPQSNYSSIKQSFQTLIVVILQYACSARPLNVD